MDEKEADNRIKSLVSMLNQYSKEYYEQDNPSISDYRYDKLMRELKELENRFPKLKRNNSPTMKVGGSSASSFEKVEHEVFMGSLKDAFNYEELYDFERRVREKIKTPGFLVEPKIDGLSVSLEYRNGVFYRGSTRGDGQVGEDVSQNLLAIKSIPKMIKTDVSSLEVRGEVYMPNSAFIELIKKQKQENKPVFKNPRNAAAGSLRQKDPSIVAQRNLDILIFNLQKAEGRHFENHLQSLELFFQLGFNVIDSYGPFDNVDQCIKEIENIGNKKINDVFPYDIDGAVIKLNSLKDREILGATSKDPRWAIAFKYPPQTKKTVVKDILVSVGRSGALTPIACFDSVMVSGSLISRASLHNQDYIDKLKIGIGDEILIRKAGEIIPEVVSVLKHGPNSTVFKIPKTCPICGSKVVKNDNEAALRCENPACPATRFKNLIHFASKDAMNIEGLGNSNIKALVDASFLKSATDIYRLTKDNLLTLDNFKHKKADNLLNAIEKSKNNDLSRVIFALGIKEVGKTTAELLAKRFKDIYSLMDASFEELKEINTIGEKIANSVINYFSLEESKILVEELAALGVNMKLKEKNNINGKLNGKTFTITGKFDNMTRNEIVEEIQKRGGNVLGSVSKKTDYLIAGQKAGSKLIKATQLNIEILGEKELMELLNT